MKNVENSILSLPPDYGEWLVSLQQRIQGTRQRAVMAVNEEQIRLYHAIGCDIAILWSDKIFRAGDRR
jgi:hypothetical protein